MNVPMFLFCNPDYYVILVANLAFEESLMN
jgi:hypothetical protein